MPISKSRNTKKNENKSKQTVMSIKGLQITLLTLHINTFRLDIYQNIRQENNESRERIAPFHFSTKDDD
jgi:sRNA-binding carbon storage regulator CsrA